MSDHHHPDIFDDAAAADYLMLPSPRSMDTIAKKYGIVPLDFPGPRKWHRDALHAALIKAQGGRHVKLGRGRSTTLQITGGVA